MQPHCPFCRLVPGGGCQGLAEVQGERARVGVGFLGRGLSAEGLGVWDVGPVCWCCRAGACSVVGVGWGGGLGAPGVLEGVPAGEPA